jgi:2-keto-4-pentenoate hydratase/2-oxohepta-3-ene-1,7-dioic acid hydratase in catechol pathway
MLLTSTPEVELGVVIGKGGRDISEAKAGEYIAGYSACSESCPPYVNQA